MIHLIILILVVLLARETVILAGQVIWLCVLLVAFCVMACVTVGLATIMGVQKLMQLRKPKLEILPPDWPDPWTKRM